LWPDDIEQKDTQHNDIEQMDISIKILSTRAFSITIDLTVTLTERLYADFRRYAECRYKCHNAQYRHGECHFAECRYKCHNAEYHYGECHFSEFHY
jgi:hypothetical protein